MKAACGAILVVALLGLILVGLGELVLVGAYVAIPVIVCCKRRPIVLRVATIAICAALLVAHGYGFKIYGSSKRANLAKLKDPVKVTRLSPPSRIHFTDGRTADLYGVWVVRTLDFGDENDFHAQHLLKSLRIFRSLGEVLEVELNSAAGPSQKATFLKRVNTAGCGNAWHPYFFPRRISRTERGDFAEALVERGAAIPSQEVLIKDKVYASQLLRRFEAWLLDLPIRHPEGIAVGKELLAHWPNHFEDAARILVQTQATDTYPALRAGLKERIGRGMPGYSQDVLKGLLWQVDANEAQQEFIRMKADSATTAEAFVTIGWYLAEQGDLSGFDYALKVIDAGGLAGEERLNVLGQMAANFRFLEKTSDGGMPLREQTAPFFPRWYEENRGNLRWRALPDGSRGFAVEGGKPFDEAYFATMKPAWAEWVAFQKLRYSNTPDEP